MLKKIILKGEQKKVLFLPATNPIQIKGVAGSGKTTVALYRAKHLLETQNTLFQEAKVIIFTFNKTLSAYIKAVSPYINGGYSNESDKISPKTPDGLNVQVVNFHSWAYRFAGIKYNQTIMQRTQIEIIGSIINQMNSDTSNVLNKRPEFFQEEVSWIKGKLFRDESEYLNARRIGRGTSDRITKKDKIVIWDVYNRYNAELKNRGKVDFDDYAVLCLNKINNSPNFTPPYTHIIIDEAQDLNKAQILTISKIVDHETNSLSIIADAAQRIYKSGFVWSEVGINVRGGRTIEFKKNYRNTVHIANAALSLLNHENDKSEFTEVKMALKGGGNPKVGYFNDFREQICWLITELSKLRENDEISNTVILHRTNAGVKDLDGSLSEYGYSTEFVKSSQPVNYESDSIKICTMSSVKGLEFKNVFIIDLNDDLIPFPPGFISDDDEFHISIERRLLYTCMTRARNNLYLLSSGTPSRYLNEINSEFLDEISSSESQGSTDTDIDDILF
jgi:superfamily I DNA/RNA helicase